MNNTSYPILSKLIAQYISCIAQLKESGALFYLKETDRIFEVLYAPGIQTNIIADQGIYFVEKFVTATANFHLF